MQVPGMKRAMGENENRSNVTECTAKRQKTADGSCLHREIFTSSNSSSVDSSQCALGKPDIGPGGDFVINSMCCVKCGNNGTPKEYFKFTANSNNTSEQPSKCHSFNGSHQCVCNILTEHGDEVGFKSINDLPQTLLISIFQGLSLSDILLRVSLVCKFWRNLCCDSGIWRHIDLKGRTLVSDAILLRLTSYSGNVNTLDLTDVRFVTNEGIQTTLKQCPRLKSLSLVRCEQLTDYAFLAIGEFCSGLTTLKLDSCSAITDQALIKLGSCCPQLQKIWLNKCGFLTDTGLVALAQGCTRLRLLSLEQCRKLTDQGMESLTTACRALEVVYLLFMGGKLTGQGLQNIAKLQQLKHLEVSQLASLTDSVLVHIVSQCPRLTYLNVSLCENISDIAIVAMTKESCHITSLHLVACKITDTALISLAKNCPTLENLDVGWCRDVTDGGATEISRGCPRLRYLGLMRCDRVTREMSQTLVEQFPHITYSTMWLDFDKLMAKARMQGFFIA